MRAGQRFLSNDTRLCEATFKARGLQGDRVLQALACKFCPYHITRADVLPGHGFAVANRLHAKMHNHLKQQHPQEVTQVS